MVRSSVAAVGKIDESAYERVCFEDLATLTTRISEAAKGLDPAQPTVYFYRLEVALTLRGEKKLAWSVTKRFSEFELIYSALSGILQNLPSFPTKLMLPSWISAPSDESIAKRKGELESFMQEVWKIPAARRSFRMQEFLGFGIQNLVFNDPVVPALQCSLSDPRFGVDSLAYDASNGLLISACEDPDVISRINSYITNTKMPWEEKVAAEIPVGVLNVWKRDSEDNWEVVAFQEYNCPCSAVFWDTPRYRAFAGVETGSVKIYEIQEPFNKVELIKDIPLHTARVSDIVYDNITDTLMTCSRDKTVILYHVAAGSRVSSLQLFDSWLMTLAFDQENHRLFVGAYSGQIAVCDVAKDSIVVLHTLVGHKDCVRSLCYYPKQEYLFSGSFDQTCTIWSVGPKGKEKAKARPVGVLKNGPPSKIKAVMYLSELKFIITGHDNGMMAFWNAVTGQVEFVLGSHKASIVELRWFDFANVLISGSRDGNVRFWSFPKLGGSKFADLPKLKESAGDKEVKASETEVKVVESLPAVGSARKTESLAATREASFETRTEAPKASSAAPASATVAPPKDPVKSKLDQEAFDRMKRAETVKKLFADDDENLFG